MVQQWSVVGFSRFSFHLVKGQSNLDCSLSDISSHLKHEYHKSSFFKNFSSHCNRFNCSFPQPPPKKKQLHAHTLFFFISHSENYQTFLEIFWEGTNKDQISLTAPCYKMSWNCVYLWCLAVQLHLNCAPHSPHIILVNLILF